jgi:transcriptional regulator with XRE-family HTH domain
MIRDRIASRIRDVRIEKKRSLDWLSAETGISRSALSRMELGQQGIDVDQLELLAIALDVSVLSFYRRPEATS